MLFGEIEPWLLPARADGGWLAQKDECEGLIGEYEEEEEETEDAVVARLEQTGLGVVVTVDRLVLQLAAACNAEMKLLIREEVFAAAVPFCSLGEALLAERAARKVDRLVCIGAEMWLVGKLDPLELLPPMEELLLALWLAAGEAGLTVESCNWMSIM